MESINVMIRDGSLVKWKKIAIGACIKVSYIAYVETLTDQK